jgi:hypothetical protein
VGKEAEPEIDGRVHADSECEPGGRREFFILTFLIYFFKYRRVWESSTQLQIHKTNSAPKLVSQTQPAPQLHRGSAQKNGGAGPNSMVFME